MTKQFRHSFDKALHMHDSSPPHTSISLLAPMSLDLRTLGKAHATLPSNPTCLQIPLDSTFTTTLDGLDYHRFGRRLAAIKRKSQRPSSTTPVDPFDSSIHKMTSIQNEPTALQLPYSKLQDSEVFQLNSTMLEGPAPTLLEMPASRYSITPGIPAPTLDTPSPCLSSYCRGKSQKSSNQSFGNSYLATEWIQSTIISGPSNPHDPGPPAAVAGRTVALTYIIAPSNSTTLQFATNDYLCIAPRSPQCIYVVLFL